MDDKTKTELYAEVLETLIHHLRNRNDVQNAHGLSESVLALPMGNDLSQSSIDLITQIIKKAINE